MDTNTHQKRCFRCTQFKPLEDFGRSKARHDGVNAECKSCRRVSRLQWVATEAMLIVGLSRKEYNQVHKQQEGKCDICGCPETSRNQWGVKKLAVDHDHVTKKFRGLLCRSCNVKLAVLEDQTFFAAAQAYLAKHNK